MTDSTNFPTPVFRTTTVNGPTGFSNPLLVSLPNLTGLQTDAQVAGQHPTMIQYNFGTASAPDDMTGTRGLLRLHGVMQLPSPNAPNVLIGLGQTMEVATNMGGSGGAALGKSFAQNPIMINRTGATFIRALTTIESDQSWEAGSSGDIKQHFSAVSFINDAVRGSVHDSAFNVTAVGGAVCVRTAFLVSDISQKFGLETDGVVLQLITAAVKTIATGVDLSGGGNVGISGNAFASKHFTVDGPTGNITTDGSVRAAGGLISDTNYLFVTYVPGAGVVPTVGGGSPVLNVAAGFNAVGDVNFWNGEYTAGTSFDFRQITSAGVSSSVAKFGTGTTAFPTSITIGANKVIGARDIGWTAMTGSPDKATAYATGSVTLAQLAGRVAQLQASLTAHGLIGA
jgi:hypothetical protein